MVAWSQVVNAGTGEIDRMTAEVEIVDAGGAGENGRMGVRSEAVAKSCNAGTDSALKAHTKSCSADIEGTHATTDQQAYYGCVNFLFIERRPLRW